MTEILWNNILQNSQDLYRGGLFFKVDANVINEKTPAPDSFFLLSKAWVSCLSFIEASVGRCSSKQVFSKSSQILQEKLVLEPNFTKVAGLLCCNVVKNRLQHRCFPVKFAKFLRTPFFTEHLQWLLLRLSGLTMFCELIWYIVRHRYCPKNFTKFLKTLPLPVTASFCHKMQNIKIHYGMQWAHCLMVSIVNEFLPISEEYLEPSRKSTMKLFCENS